MLLAMVVVGSIGALGAQDNLSAAPTQAGSSPAAQTPVPSTPPPATATTLARVGAPARYVPNRVSRHEQMYYQGVWGVEDLKVKYTESGEMIRFSWRVVDPTKAAALNDKKAEPALYDAQSQVKLVVPQMEKVGKLRQSSTPIAGQSYWMAFSNSGRRVRPGHRVDVAIGNFRAANLMVE